MERGSGEEEGEQVVAVELPLLGCACGSGACETGGAAVLLGSFIRGRGRKGEGDGDGRRERRQDAASTETQGKLALVERPRRKLCLFAHDASLERRKGLLE